MKRPPAICFAVLPLAALLLNGIQPDQKAALEIHLRNMRQLTFGGENAEAYFSFDGTKLIFQSTRDGRQCDQIYMMNLDGSALRMISTGKGRTTCGYFLKDGKHFIYSSTHLADERCPPKPDFSKGYVWAIHGGFDLFLSDYEKNLVQLTRTSGYDAEATVSPDGKKIVFTSVRDGDLEIYSMNIDGSEVKRLTHTVGYDGGAFFSPDGKKIVYRAFHPGDEKSVSRYKELLAQHLIEPRQLELFVMEDDGSNQTQITRNQAANFCPFFHPNGKQIIFSSNLGDPRGRNFDLYLINLDGTGLKQITCNETFDGFPMFSPDGKKLVFASNRNGKVRGETNIFIADWVE
jgi:TolB protein